MLDTERALRIARDKELDLLLVAPNAQPPVAKIVDYAKFLYDERKKLSAARAKSKKSELKELRFGPSTDEGDINRYINRAKEFLADGNRVKITVKMRGREMMFPEVAFEQLKKVERGLAEDGKIESPAKRMGSDGLGNFCSQVGKTYA
ncbi:MAG: translation initiation factor IF-3 [Patescibacteria group bacterium]|nr:MAG: translation initiation factor IF-3 [Patescibacteria group bacterium]